MNQAARSDKPTGKQLRYLRQLAERCGESFVYPKTVAEASAQIERLKQRRPSGRAERGREVAAVRRAVAGGGADALSGWG